MRQSIRSFGPRAQSFGFITHSQYRMESFGIMFFFFCFGWRWNKPEHSNIETHCGRTVTDMSASRWGLDLNVEVNCAKCKDKTVQFNLALIWFDVCFELISRTCLSVCLSPSLPRWPLLSSATMRGQNSSWVPMATRKLCWKPFRGSDIKEETPRQVRAVH